MNDAKEILERLKTIKLLEENKGKISLTLVLEMNFLGMTPNAQATKARINKWDYIKLKSFCTAKEVINKIKDNLVNGRKYLQTIFLIKG